MDGRIEYLDYMKGLAIFMVVFCHVFTCCVATVENFWFLRVFDSIMLPSFFLISGYLVCVSVPLRFLFKRCRYVLFPTIVMFLLYVWIFNTSWSGIINSLNNEFKSGYWFTYALFVMNFLHSIVSVCTKNLKKYREPFILVLLFFLSAFVIFLKDWDWYHNGACLYNWGSLRLIAKYFPIYIIGVFCGCHKDYFLKYITNGWIMGGILIIFVWLVSSSTLGFNGSLVASICGSLIIFSFVYKSQSWFCYESLGGRQLLLFGRNTLAIYFIHFFFLSGLKVPMLQEIDANESWFVIVVISSILTVLLLYASLLLKKIISISEPLYHLLLGK